MDSVSIGWPGLLFSALFVAGLVWLRRGGRGGVIFLGALMLIEVVFWPFYPRDTAEDWIVQTSFLVLGAVGTVAAVGELWTSRRAAPKRV